MCAGTMCGGIFGVLAPAGSIGPMALISKIIMMMMIMMMNIEYDDDDDDKNTI